MLNLGQTIAVSIGVTAMMWRAAAGVVAGRLTVGDLVLVNAYLLQLSAPLFLLGMVYREFKQALVNLERLFGLLDEPRDVQDRPGAVALVVSQPRIQLRWGALRLRPRAARSCTASTSRSRRAEPWQWSATRARASRRSRACCTASTTSTPGAIRIDGRDLREFTQASLRAAIAIVPQDTVLFNDTIYYNIRYGRPEASRAEVEEAARAAHIHAFISALPDGYETEVGERGLKLSGGEKQRVAIARALLKNPAILIFDEATSALDSKSEQAIQAELDRIQVGRTTLVIAHRLSTVMGADEILVMDAGRIVERGGHGELLAARGRYAQMWQLQQLGREEEESPARARAADGAR